jgi:hypothetical protein
MSKRKRRGAKPPEPAPASDAPVTNDERPIGAREDFASEHEWRRFHENLWLVQALSFMLMSAEEQRQWKDRDPWKVAMWMYYYWHDTDPEKARAWRPAIELAKGCKSWAELEARIEARIEEEKRGSQPAGQ